MKLTLSCLALDSSAATTLALYSCTGGGTTSPVKLSGIAMAVTGVKGVKSIMAQQQQKLFRSWSIKKLAIKTFPQSL